MRNFSHINRNFHSNDLKIFLGVLFDMFNRTVIPQICNSGFILIKKKILISSRSNENCDLNACFSCLGRVCSVLVTHADLNNVRYIHRSR